MYSLRTVWEASSEAERDMPLMIHEKSFDAQFYPPEPVRSHTTVNDYVDGKQTHPAVLVLSDLAPEEVK